MKCLLSSNVVKEKKFRIVGAVILSIFVITVIIICSTLLRSGDDGWNSVDENSTEVSSSFTKALIVQIGNSDLWALDFDNENFTYLIKNWKDRIHSFDYYMGNTVYIGSYNAGNPIKSSSEKYPELSQPNNWIADKIAVDYVDGKVYVLDIITSNINVFDVEGKYYNIVLSHFQDSKDIALDSMRRLIFIMLSSSIVRANIDGSSQKTIVHTIPLSSFAIDYKGKVYYADLENINSVNYVGNEHKIVSKISNLVISMAALENKLFWLHGPYESQDAILYSCAIINGICDSISKISFDGKLLEIKAYNFDESNIWNPCQNYGCEHMCITNSTNSCRCVCSIGWQLDADSKSCKPADDFLLYVEGNHVRSKFLNDLSESFVEAILPVELNASYPTECFFDFDVRKRLLIYSDGSSMHKMVLTSDGKQIDIESDHSSKMTVPAVDWISNNLYYVSTETVLKDRSDGLKIPRQLFSIKAHSMRSSESLDNDKIIAGSKYLVTITSLVVHPNKGILFYVSTENPDVYVDIHKRQLDGGSGALYIEMWSVSRDKNALGIDCEDDQIYWFDNKKINIYFTDVNVVDIQKIDIKYVGIENPVTMSIHKSWLYVSTANSVWRLDKISGQNAIKIISQFQQESPMIFGAKIFSQATQPIDKSHPCAINNEDCQRYCFGIPSKSKTLQKVCGCAREEKLNLDGRTCQREY